MTKKSDAAPAEVQNPAEVKEPRVTIGSVVTELVMDAIFFNMAKGDFDDSIFWRIAEAII